MHRNRLQRFSREKIDRFSVGLTGVRWIETSLFQHPTYAMEPVCSGFCFTQRSPLMRDGKVGCAAN